jgi:hypothetical protein
MAGQTLLVRDVDAAQDQRPPARERVRVDPQAGADRQGFVSTVMGTAT